MATEPSLAEGYEIRVLTPAHSQWANALVMHSTAFASPVWSKIYSENKTRLCYDLYSAGTYLMDHQIASGLSLGLFHKHYQFKRPESAETGGKLYWDVDDETADGDALLAQMDFPLISVAMAYDSFHALDPGRIAPLLDVMPLLGVRNTILQARDARGAAETAGWQATGPGQVIFRNSTGTRPDETGKGFMKVLAWHMMRRAATDGWRGIQISCLHDAVCRVWSRPPAQFRAEIVARFHCREDEDEEVRKTFGRSGQEITKIYVTLR